MPSASNGMTLGELLGRQRRQEPWQLAMQQAIEPLRTAIATTQPLSFRAFVDRVNPRFIWYDHCVRLAAVLQRVADGELTRVIIAEPPRHGKSEQVSRLFSAYYLYRHPERFVGLTSYAADLATTLSRSARDNYRRGGGVLREDAAAIKHWETGLGGGMWAAGFGGPVTGKGGHLLIVDDPVKNAEEAASEVIGQKNRDWYRSTLYTRLEPGGAVILMQTRWPGPGDLIGFMLEEESGEEPEAWHVVSFEAEKEAELLKIPPTCTLEPDPREVGEPLCPERYPLDRLRKIAETLGPFFYAALFQQRPRPREGVMFPRDRATIVDALPADATDHLRYWDKAGTEGGGKRTAGVRMCRVGGKFYVVDVAKAHLGAERRQALMRQTAEIDGTGVRIFSEQEPGSGGKESAENDVKLLAGFMIQVDKVTGDKTTRADPLAAQWQAGNVCLVRGAWNKAYLDELEAFPFGNFKDQADASSGAFNKLTLGPVIRIR